MLRITRRPGERIVLGDDVFVEVLEVSGQTVRLGFDAPRSVPIYREEIWLEVKRENEAAAKAPRSEMPAELPLGFAAELPLGPEAKPNGAAPRVEAQPAG